MKSYTYKIEISQKQFFDILHNRTLEEWAYCYERGDTDYKHSFYGKMTDSTAKIRAYVYSKRQLFNPIVNIDTVQDGDMTTVTLEPYIDFPCKVLIFALICAIAYLSFEIIKSLIVGAYFYHFIIPIVFIIGFLLIAKLMYKTNKENFFERFKFTYRKFYIQTAD